MSPLGGRCVSNGRLHDLNLGVKIAWVTIALTGGVPLELVQKVTGHKTTEIVLKHYFQPGREAFRQALNAAMSKLLTNGHQEEKAEGRNSGKMGLQLSQKHANICDG